MELSVYIRSSFVTYMLFRMPAKRLSRKRKSRGEASNSNSANIVNKKSKSKGKGSLVVSDDFDVSTVTTPSIGEKEVADRTLQPSKETKVHHPLFYVLSGINYTSFSSINL